MLLLACFQKNHRKIGTTTSLSWYYEHIHALSSQPAPMKKEGLFYFPFIICTHMCYIEGIVVMIPSLYHILKQGGFPKLATRPNLCTHSAPFSGKKRAQENISDMPRSDLWRYLVVCRYLLSSRTGS